METILTTETRNSQRNTGFIIRMSVELHGLCASALSNNTDCILINFSVYLLSLSAGVYEKNNHPAFSFLRSNICCSIFLFVLIYSNLRALGSPGIPVKPQ